MEERAYGLAVERARFVVVAPLPVVGRDLEDATQGLPAPRIAWPPFPDLAEGIATTPHEADGALLIPVGDFCEVSPPRLHLPQFDSPPLAGDFDDHRLGSRAVDAVNVINPMCDACRRPRTSAEKQKLPHTSPHPVYASLRLSLPRAPITVKSTLDGLF